jgi:hypothetical protein
MDQIHARVVKADGSGRAEAAVSAGAAPKLACCPDGSALARNFAQGGSLEPANASPGNVA